MNTKIYQLDFGKFHGLQFGIHYLIDHNVLIPAGNKQPRVEDMR